MAKARKSKNDEQRQDSSGALVRHQKLCISVDMQKERIYGYTEMKVVVPENGLAGLHADNMNIDRVSVDGEQAEFDFFPHYQHVADDKRWSFVSSPSSAADAAGSVYLQSLDREMAPNLLVLCNKSAKSGGDQPLEISAGTDGQENVKLVRVDYWVEKPESGLHFYKGVLHTDNQIRRARCWFPCIDSSSQRCCFDLEFTVDSRLVAVSNGILLFQVLSKDDPSCKTYVYKLSVPVCASWISLAVVPFEIFPDRHSSILSYMCLSPLLQKLRNTISFLHSAFSHYEDYLSSSFPFGSYKQVFIMPEMAVSPLSLGASIGIFSSQLLFDEKVIDQTIRTRVKLAHALAKQWFGIFITAETPNDEWLLDGLAGFLIDSFIKRFLGNNEARYRRYKANCAVCRADITGATALSSSTASADLYGTQNLGFYGKIRSWKAVAVLQMLEKQMGPESFCKILQIIISRAQKDKTGSLRTLSTKEFRQFANKIGNLERPFLKEFFPRWVGSSGCPVLRMGFSYNKRRNMIELAVLRDCTSTVESVVSVPKDSPEMEKQEGDVGWPGMMSIRIHELDGMYDHPSLPMAGETCQLLEIQCHSKLAAKRIQKPKKSSKPDGSDDNGDAPPSVDPRSSVESPLLWVRVDPEMEYLAEIHFHQPLQMWINQLEKDKDVVAQAQAIAILETLSPHSFSVVNALTNLLNDSKAFWRVRIDAAFALAGAASEETDWAGFQNLLNFFKTRRYDSTTGFPRPNDFHDFPEYFVLEAIPHAIAMVRKDHKSPQEAVEFVIQLLKYNDNHGNPFSDVYWLSALIHSIGELEFGKQSMLLLPSILKRIDRLLQFDRLLPSYNGILTISCIRTLTQMALKLSSSISLNHVSSLIKPFRKFDISCWQIRIEASRALLDLEFGSKGINAALLLFLNFLEEESTLRGQVKLSVHMLHLCQAEGVSQVDCYVKIPTLVGLLCVLESRQSFNNVFLRHHLFCILQALAQRPTTLYGLSRVQVPPTTDFATFSSEMTKTASLKLRIPNKPPDPSLVDTPQNILVDPLYHRTESSKENNEAAGETCDPVKENTDTVSNASGRKISVVKIRVRQSAASSRAEERENNVIQKSHDGQHEAEVGPCSSASVDAPIRVTNERTSYQNVEEVHSSHCDVSSSRGEDMTKELQCIADSRNKESDISLLSLSSLPPERETNGQKEPSRGNRTVAGDAALSSMDWSAGGNSVTEKEKKKKDKKRKREGKREEKGDKDDLKYLEWKRQKKEKKKARQKEKGEEKATHKEEEESGKDQLNVLTRDAAVSSLAEPLYMGIEPLAKEKVAEVKQPTESIETKPAKIGSAHKSATPGRDSTQNKLRIKIKSRTAGS